MDLSQLTTMKVGGPAQHFFAPTTADELAATAHEVWASGDEWLVVGGGSNLVVADEGFEGSVIHVLTRGIERTGNTLVVQAGEPWESVVAFAVENALAGIEALSGIPGSSGAAPIQNIGAYGQEVGDRLVAVDFVDADTGERLRLEASDLELGYRTSSLKQHRRGLVVAIELDLTPGGLSDPIAYPQLANTLGVELGARLPIEAVRDAVLTLRASKGMVLDPNDPDSVSAGSFFTNPIVSENFARDLPAGVPRWPADDGVKLSAAWLIEHSDIAKGFSLPGSRAAVSSKHTLAIVNAGGATATQVAELARYLQTRVLTAFGVILQPEPTLVGVAL